MCKSGAHYGLLSNYLRPRSQGALVFSNPEIANRDQSESLLGPVQQQRELPVSLPSRHPRKARRRSTRKGRVVRRGMGAHPSPAATRDRGQLPRASAAGGMFTKDPLSTLCLDAGRIVFGCPISARRR